jgi:crotonobetainyl-CoA:carnitine CoA-transferase CaiB-like acyl-CoA transferase
VLNDLSRVLAGPWCTQTLADLGADVIKIERPARRRRRRHPRLGPALPEGPARPRHRRGRLLPGANRNKRSMTCRHRPARGPGADPRTGRTSATCSSRTSRSATWRVTAWISASLLALNPRLVYCSITGFGQTGPYRDRAGYDYAIQGMGGLMSVTGERRRPPGGGPQKVGVAVADLFTGMYASGGDPGRAAPPRRTGEGQYIDMALLDTQVAMLANLGANYLATGKAPRRCRQRAPEHRALPDLRGGPTAT